MSRVAEKSERNKSMKGKNGMEERRCGIKIRNNYSRPPLIRIN